MSTHKFIYWRNDLDKKDGHRYANVHLLVGYMHNTLDAYQKLLIELQKTFPHLTPTDVECGKVHKSHWCQGFTIIAFSSYLEEGNYDGWTQIENKTGEYFW